MGAYALSPTLGSEFAQGWNYAKQMSKRYDLTLLVGSSDGAMGEFAQLTAEVLFQLGDVRVERIEPDFLCKAIKYLDRRLGLSWTFVLGLRRWHWLAYRRALQIHRIEPFDAAHQLGPVGFRNPGYLYKLPIPGYWGPVGGLQYINIRLAFHSSFRYGLTALIRNMNTFVAARSAYVRKAVRGFRCLSFATEMNRINFKKIYGVDGAVCSDQAIESSSAGAGMDKPHELSGPLTAIWCGSVDGRKNITMLLDIAAALQGRGANVRIAVVGSGPLEAYARTRARRERLDNVQFFGRMPRAQVRDLMQRSSCILFTSLSEANTATFFEGAEALCIPLALDLDGFSKNISPEYGFKVNPSEAVDVIVDRYASALSELASDPGRRTRMRNSLSNAREALGWAELACKHTAVLECISRAGVVRNSTPRECR